VHIDKLMEQNFAETFYAAEKNSIDGHLFNFISQEKYFSAIKYFPHYPIKFRNKLVGGALLDKNRFHIAVLKEYRGKVGKEIIASIDWGLSYFNPFEARINAKNVEAKNLIKRYKSKIIKKNDQEETYLIFRRT